MHVMHLKQMLPVIYSVFGGAKVTSAVLETLSRWAKLIFAKKKKKKSFLEAFVGFEQARLYTKMKYLSAVGIATNKA